MINIVRLVLFIIVLVSCKSNQDFDQKPIEKSIQLDTIVFSLHSELPEGSMSNSYTSFVVEDTIFFVEDDMMSNRLIIYVFNNENNKLDWFTKSYPNSWSKSVKKRYFFKNRSDFYLLDDNSSLYHFKGDSVKLLSILNEYDPAIKLSGLYSSQNNEFTVDSLGNVVTRVFYSRPDSLVSEEYYEPITAFFNLTENSLELLDYNLPIKFKSKYLGMYNAYNQNYSKTDTIIYWSSIEDKITVYDVVNKSKKDVVARSKYQNSEFQKISVNASASNRDEFYLQSIEQGRYSYLIHNPFLNIYYRVYQHPISRGDHFESDRVNGGYSVMVLDDDFKVLDEVLLSKEIKSVFVLIPTQNGLLLNTSNGYVLKGSVDKLCFLNLTYE